MNFLSNVVSCLVMACRVQQEYETVLLDISLVKSLLKKNYPRYVGMLDSIDDKQKQ